LRRLDPYHRRGAIETRQYQYRACRQAEPDRQHAREGEPMPVNDIELRRESYDLPLVHRQLQCHGSASSFAPAAIELVSAVELAGVALRKHRYWAYRFQSRVRRCSKPIPKLWISVDAPPPVTSL
jgi:hypothetical protein